MNQYYFIAANDVDLMSLNDAQLLENISETLQLSSLGELSLLISQLDSGLTIPPPVNMEDVKEIWTVTEILCHFSHDEFEVFYSNWLKKSDRNDSAEERDQLERLNAFVPEFNKAKHRLIILLPNKLSS